MSRIKEYQEFLILEKYDANLRVEIKKLGVTKEEDIKKMVSAAKRGYLHDYLTKRGYKFTFGILESIFKDAIAAKRTTELKKGLIHLLPSVVPLVLLPFFPTIAIVSSVFGASKLFHNIFDPLFGYLNPRSKYTDFLKRMIDLYMKIPEGRASFKDRFTRAFVVSDKLIQAIKPEVLDEFSTYLCIKMEAMGEDDEVPDNYIENELKTYLNKTYDVTPEIPLKP